MSNQLSLEVISDHGKGMGEDVDAVNVPGIESELDM